MRMNELDHTVKCLGSKDAIRAQNTLSLDFDPRDLVVSWRPSQSSPERHSNPKLQAIYVPSRCRAQHVSRLLASLCDSGVPVYLLPTFASDVPAMAANPCVEQLSVQDPDFLGAMRGLRCQSNPLFAVATNHWDLPLKRNYALWHAHKHHVHRILLLDDDIRGLNAARLGVGARALAQWAMAGFFVDDFPDTSVIGHVELALGEPVSPFLSGSCLFVRTDAPSGPFPPIYNEDWICMAPEVAQGRVVSLGSVKQEPYDPFTCASHATYQEPGEIIADGLFALLAAGRYEDRLDSSAWRTLVTLRRYWLESLARRANDPRHQAAVDQARIKCDEITELDCVGFISDWEHDRTQWISCLEELK